MTVENCIRLLKVYQRRIDLQGDEFAESKPDGRGRDAEEIASILRTSKKAIHSSGKK